MQPHPEQTQFEKKNPTIRYLRRTKEVIDVTSGFIRSFMEENRLRRNYEITPNINTKSYMSYNFIPFPSHVISFDYIYMFADMSACGTTCGSLVSSEEYTDNLYDIFKSIRHRKKFETIEQGFIASAKFVRSMK